MDSDNEPEIIFKWTNSCRLCLSTDSNIDLFSQDSSQEVLKKIRSCLNFLIYNGDPMPRKLCASCLIKVNDWCEFKENCLKVENDLKRRLDNYKKIDFVQEYFNKCATFSSSEVVSSSKIPASHEEINSSVISNVNEDDNRSNSTNSSQTCGSSSHQEPPKIRVCTDLYSSPKAQAQFTQDNGKREVAVQVNLYPEPNPYYEPPTHYKRDVRKSFDDVATIESITGSASALWEVPHDSEIEDITEELIHHEIIIKQEINTVTCPNCGVEFVSDDEYAFHSCNPFQAGMADETDFFNISMPKIKITPWKCEACCEYYQTKKSLTEHYDLTCKGEQYGMVGCKFCKRQFISKSEMYQHQLCHMRINFRLTEDDLYCCRKCTRRFCSEGDFNKHYEKHLADEAKYACDICGKLFMKKEVYLSHVKNHNTSKTEMLKNRVTESLMDTSSQESASSGSSKRCFRCGKFFADEKELEKHRLLKHKNPTPFSCRLCNHKFSARSQLLFHIRSHRGGNKQKPTAESSKCCSVCNAKFILLSDLQSHMMTHTNQQQQQQEEKEEEVKPPLDETVHDESRKDVYMLGRFKCSLCPRIFARLNSVPKHMRIAHLGQSGVALKLKRPLWVNKWSNLPLPFKKVKFQCNLCPKFFYSKDNLSLHVERGHSVKKEPEDPEAENSESNNIEVIQELPFQRKPSSHEKQCMICKNIYSRNYLQQHIKRCHPDYRRALWNRPVVVRTPAPKSTVVKTPSSAPVSAASSAASPAASPAPSSSAATEEKRPEMRKIFKCKHCFRALYNEYLHRRHENACVRIQKKKCTVCGIRLHAKTASNHLETCKSVRCRKCNKIFFKHVAYLSHVCSNVRGDKFKCGECFSNFQSQDLLDMHMKEAHNIEIPESLPEITISVPEPVTKQELPETPQDSVADLSETYDGGDITPSNPKKMKQKLELWEEESNKIVARYKGRFYCTLCNLYFGSEEESSQHGTEHPRGNFYAVQISDHLFQCTVCDKKYNHRKKCLIHINYHKKNSKHYKRLSHKNGDARATTNQPPVVETVTVEESEEQKLYQCTVCPSAFTTERSYNIHSYYVHSNDVKNNVSQ